MRNSLLIEQPQGPEGDTVVVFRDFLGYETINAVWRDLTRLLKEQPPKKLILDFRNTNNLDSSGIALLRFVHRHCEEHQIAVHYQSVPPAVEHFIRYITPVPPRQLAQESRPFFADPISLLGKSSSDKIADTYELIHFLGTFVASCFRSLRRIHRFRWKETFYYAQLAGSDAMPIVFLLTFLIGLVMAFQAAVQLRQFGANIFVADLVSLVVTRELGPVFTAVILAGRSGSAFAAEIGTMRINEEVDALAVMGIEVIDFLVLPKVFALALVGPLLTLFADASSILGGILVGVLSLDLTVGSFLDEMYQVLTLGDVFSGVFKGFVFSVLVAIIGCLRGLQTDKGADSVGRQTTSAVVSGIFLIIFADAIFTVLFYVFDW